MPERKARRSRPRVLRRGGRTRPVQRRAVLRRLQPQLHLGHPDGRERLARPAAQTFLNRPPTRSTSSSGPAATCSTLTSAAARSAGCLATEPAADGGHHGEPDERAGAADRAVRRQRLVRSRGDALTYAWDLDDDGRIDDGSAVTAYRTYSSPWQRHVRLRATEPAGASNGTAMRSSAVSNSPPVPVIFSAAGTTFRGRRHHQLQRPRQRPPGGRLGRHPR